MFLTGRSPSGPGEIVRLLAEVQRKPAPPERDELVSSSGDKMVLVEAVAAIRVLETGVERLRERLRQHGIAPDDASPQTACADPGPEPKRA